MLQLENISKRFGATNALKDVNFSLFEGEICGLVGHNGAGKSTLIKIIAGAERADRGTAVFNGTPLTPLSPHASYAAGIRVIHQDAPLVSNLDTVENCFLGRRYPRRFGTIDRAAMGRAIAEVAEKIAPELDLDVPVMFLPPAQKQFVRLLKAVSDAGGLLILDEPTAALPAEDAQIFFAALQRLRTRGTSILFVSHRLDEIAQCCDRCVILRDGQAVAELSGNDLSVDRMISAMSGENGLPKPARPEPVKPVPAVAKTAPGGKQKRAILEVSHLRVGELSVPASFKVHGGEVITLYGLAGSGRSSLLHGIWGAEKSTGTMMLAGKAYAPKSPRDAVRAGVSYVPADRHKTALFADHPLTFNSTLPLLAAYRYFARVPVPDQHAERAAFERAAGEVFMAFSSEGQLARSLSGGNQQKLIFSRWATRSSRVMLLDEPTEGVDVKARAVIKRIVADIAADGNGVLFSTSDRNEALELGDRVMVFRDGAIVEILARAEASHEALAAGAQAKSSRQTAAGLKAPDQMSQII
ncbi:MAG: sugar ABC transporter ATP-binding protein [Alphaproteobacteria bacterium]|nr:sugar ABC transporter ATP-binding protein [Alphaproteobacteria bacterium]